MVFQVFIISDLYLSKVYAKNCFLAALMLVLKIILYVLRLIFIVSYSLAQGLTNKYICLKELLESHDVDICCITETWTGDSVNNSEFLADGYVCYRSDRKLEYYTEGTFTSNNRAGAAIVLNIVET